MRVRRWHVLSLGLAATGLLAGCGATPHPTAHQAAWQLVQRRSLTVTREDSGVVVPAQTRIVRYQGFLTEVSQDRVHVGQTVPSGAPLVAMKNGQLVSAPAAGVVKAVAPVGSYVGTPPPGVAVPGPTEPTVAVVATKAPLTVAVRVPADQSAPWHRGAHVTLTGKTKPAGTIVSTDSPRQGFVTVKAVFASAAAQPFNTVDLVKVLSRTLPGVLTVPAAAVLSHGSSGYAVRTPNGLVAVKVLAANANWVAVSGNLFPKEKVWTPPTEGASSLFAQNSP
ncbi:hypothetical protein [Sulfobacillus harzensis]|uniref:Uncharacterized protein n=1 Tax=Sulfobacillus harzensis TaxID=2729629 RepID=A0A7Y0Q1G4_9FIRM|nr:hypothetical protein [Sulfobacillus harzensis]NMP22068.1 hypothetical protein [Sulfobacillus harzensis]